MVQIKTATSNSKRIFLCNPVFYWQFVIYPFLCTVKLPHLGFNNKCVFKERFALELYTVLRFLLDALLRYVSSVHMPKNRRNYIRCRWMVYSLLYVWICVFSGTLLLYTCRCILYNLWVCLSVSLSVFSTMMTVLLKNCTGNSWKVFPCHYAWTCVSSDL